MSLRVVRIMTILALFASVLVMAPAAGASSLPATQLVAPQAAADPTVALTGAKAASGGQTHTCVINADNTVSCWGYNGSGQLGNGTTANRDLPTMVPGLTNVSQIATGGAHTCALTGGAVKCWGDSTKGQIGDGQKINRLAPVQVSGLTSGVKGIAAGSQHTCAILADNTARCWGFNDQGQLGDASNNDRVIPVVVAGALTGVIKLTAGSKHTCALTSGGGIKCWGANANGQLGNGQTFPRNTPQDTGISGATDVNAGDAHTCAALNDGSARCWGDNVSGQLGNGTLDDSLSPIAVPGLGGVTQVSAGGAFSCARLNTGAVFCWGDNQAGQIGDGSGANRTSPVATTGISGATQVEAGGAHVCAIVAGGALRCWGDNSYGQLADGALMYRAVRSDVSGMTSVLGLSAGIGHTCALLPGGTIKCWGNNFYGQLGDGTKIQRSTPTLVPGLAGINKVAAGGGHTCALTSGGGVKCWGYNNYGQLGDNTIIDKINPVDVDLGAIALDVVAGFAHTCALTSSGGVKCWGRNDEGQLGDGSGIQANKPVNVAGLAVGVNSISAGGSHTCAVLSTGGVKCWGANRNGQVGNDTTTQVNSPADVTGLTNVFTVAAGGSHTCAKLNDGTAKCWGNNDKGQVGDGTFDQRNTPVAVPGVSDILILAAGGPHTCAISTGGVTRCWGNGGSGELGNWSLANTPSATVANGASSGATDIALGQSHTCLELGDQLISCFGWDGSGQLGQGITTRRLAPVDAQVAMPATLTLNHANGKAGSEFLLTGHRFPPGETITFTINGVANALTLNTATSDSGSFVLDLITTAGNPAGVYSVKATSASREASAIMRLGDQYPTRSDPGNSLDLSAAGVQPMQLMYTYVPIMFK